MTDPEPALKDGLPIVTSATAFMTAAERGDAVAFEIEPGHWLRSDIEGPPDFLKLRLENIVEAERIDDELASGEAQSR